MTSKLLLKGRSLIKYNFFLLPYAYNIHSITLDVFFLKNL